MANGVRCHKRSRKRTEQTREAWDAADLLQKWPRGSLVKTEVYFVTVTAPVPRVWAELRCGKGRRWQQRAGDSVRSPLLKEGGRGGALGAAGEFQFKGFTFFPLKKGEI